MIFRVYVYFPILLQKCKYRKRVVQFVVVPDVAVFCMSHNNMLQCSVCHIMTDVAVFCMSHNDMLQCSVCHIMPDVAVFCMSHNA